MAEEIQGVRGSNVSDGREWKGAGAPSGAWSSNVALSHSPCEESWSQSRRSAKNRQKFSWEGEVGAREEEVALMCQATEEGPGVRVCEMARENLTQASVDGTQLVPSCLAASVQHLFTVSSALGLYQQPPGFGLIFVKTFCSAPTDS